MTPLQTEFSFRLPRGYVDPAGNLHRDGFMRLARALDEVVPIGDPQARNNDGWLSILMLSRVISRLGDISPVTPAIVGDLFAQDFAYLQDLYLRLNASTGAPAETQCPACGERFELDLTGIGDYA
jgi:hypothetical protein